MRAVFLITVRFYFYQYSDAAVTLCVCVQARSWLYPECPFVRSTIVD